VDRPALDEISPGTPRASSRRFVWHLLGLILAGVLAWLLLMAYRQPEFMLELSNMSLC